MYGVVLKEIYFILNVFTLNFILKSSFMFYSSFCACVCITFKLWFTGGDHYEITAYPITYIHIY